MTAPARIEVLYFDDCPNAKVATRHARDAVLLVAQASDIEAEIVRIVVSTPEEAIAHRFLGSPTVRVNGIDVEPAARQATAYSFSCRVYNVNGQPLGAPPIEWIAEALRTR